ncbi:MAG: AsmA family protein, partial [Hyphomicrobiales bacterium]|nr:AsmA family protein [Hyphomicrobiales bacterium]
FLVVIAVGGAIFLVTNVDPNEYKPQISQKVESLTGRKLTLGGDISWRFYPWVGVTLNDFSLSNREGFAPENMIEATQVDVQLKVLPLLSKQLDIGKIDLQSPKINLSIDTQGLSNWDDLSEKGATDAPKIEKPEQAAGAMLGGLVVQGVDISQGEIGWNDQAAGQSYQLSDFNLNTGTIEPGLPVDFDLKSGMSGTGLPADAQLSLKGSLLLNQAMDGVQLENLVTRLNMDKIQAGFDLAMLTFSLADGKLAVVDFQVEGSNEEAMAKLNIDTLSYGLESQLAELGKLTLSGQYQQFPVDGEMDNVRFDINSNTLSVAAHAFDAKY